MSIISEVKPKRDYNKFPFVHNAKVLWIYGSYIESVSAMYDRSYALCRKFMKDHKRDGCYAKGKLVVVSMLDNEYKRY